MEAPKEYLLAIAKQAYRLANDKMIHFAPLSAAEQTRLDIIDSTLNILSTDQFLLRLGSKLPPQIIVPVLILFLGFSEN